ncbi:nucleotidyltransferase family protein [Salibacterium qingdaonense]|uniref:CBS domain-containing protein n=1 Tax=Salibacterium qingdaonense TaxID=266892 RepID=A0A1I4KZF0_9BACI|nr:nucleotidyltransferase family protein [Salibacterium qingdaonense]SFL84128.1 CBS domain-containing protein [Salibacterium qingdaonense]
MQNWEKIVVNQHQTILETMKIIDQEASQFTVVVDEHNYLLGTVTDGDVRRGLLKGVSLKEKVDQVMNTNPTIAVNDENATVIFQHSTVEHLPVVNDDYQLIKVISKQEVKKAPKKPNKVVLMAGGLGTRLRPLTETMPKPLLKIGEKPILEIIIESFKMYGFTDIYLCVNYKRELIKDYFQDGRSFGVSITYIDESINLGTAGPLSLLEDEINEPFFVMNADLLTTINFEQLLRFHKDNQSYGTMCVREYEYQVPYGVIRTNGDQLTSIEEKPLHKEFVNAGIYVLDPELLHLIPYNQFYDMPELFRKMMEQNYSLSAFPLREYWLDIGRYDDYQQANNDFYEVFE